VYQDYGILYVLIAQNQRTVHPSINQSIAQSVKSKCPYRGGVTALFGSKPPIFNVLVHSGQPIIILWGLAPSPSAFPPSDENVRLWRL